MVNEGLSLKSVRLFALCSLLQHLQSFVFSALSESGTSSAVKGSQSPSPTRRTLASHNILALAGSLAAADGVDFRQLLELKKKHISYGIFARQHPVHANWFQQVLQISYPNSVAFI
jgi:hypothetical protein